MYRSEWQVMQFALKSSAPCAAGRVTSTSLISFGVSFAIGLEEKVSSDFLSPQEEKNKTNRKIKNGESDFIFTTCDL